MHPTTQHGQEEPGKGSPALLPGSGQNPGVTLGRAAVLGSAEAAAPRLGTGTAPRNVPCAGRSCAPGTRGHIGAELGPSWEPEEAPRPCSQQKASPRRQKPLGDLETSIFKAKRPLERPDCTHNRGLCILPPAQVCLGTSPLSGHLWMLMEHNSGASPPLFLQ